MIKQSFIFAAVLTFIGSLLHIAIIVGGPDWYLTFGAGESMTKLTQSDSIYPAFIGSILVCIFFGWSLYALSGAGIIRPPSSFKVRPNTHRRFMHHARIIWFLYTIVI